MHPHEALIRQLFDRLGARDAAGVARCYHPAIFYSSPLFPRLHGAAAADAWHLAFERIGTLDLTLTGVEAQADGAIAHWHARYRLGSRGVSHRGRSMFAFRSGAIVRHYDAFAFWPWAARAFGPPGVLLGWSAPFKWKLRRDLARALERLSDSRP